MNRLQTILVVYFIIGLKLVDIIFKSAIYPTWAYYLTVNDEKDSDTDYNIKFVKLTLHGVSDFLTGMLVLYLFYELAMKQ